VFEEELSRFIDQVLEEGHYRFKRNRVYTLKELLLLLLKACTQNITLKSETAIYGSQETGKPYTRQNLEYRLDHFPEEILQKVLEKISLSYHRNPLAKSHDSLVSRKVAKQFKLVLAIDGTTLDQIRKTKGLYRERGEVLKTHKGYTVTSGGHMLVKLDLSNLMIVGASYHANPLVNDTNFIEEHLSWTKQKTLTMMHRGFYSFALFEGILQAGAHFIIPFRKGTRIVSKTVLTQTAEYRESLVQIGVKPKLNYPLRLIEYDHFPTFAGKEAPRVLLTSVINPQKLPAEEVIRCYAQRWTIETFFKRIKTDLALSRLRSSKSRHIDIQALCTLIVYQIYNRFRIAIANELRRSVQDISLAKEMQLLKTYAHKLSLSRQSQKKTGWKALFHKAIRSCGKSISMVVEKNRKAEAVRLIREIYYLKLSRLQAA